LLRQLVQGQQVFQQFQQQRDGHNVLQPQVPGPLSTQPPLFHKTEDALDADTWIRPIQSMFSLLVVPCSDANKARFAEQ
jgi:hypothetical protein